MIYCLVRFQRLSTLQSSLSTSTFSDIQNCFVTQKISNYKTSFWKSNTGIGTLRILIWISKTWMSKIWRWTLNIRISSMKRLGLQIEYLVVNMSDYSGLFQTHMYIFTHVRITHAHIHTCTHVHTRQHTSNILGSAMPSLRPRPLKGWQGKPLK